MKKIKKINSTALQRMTETQIEDQATLIPNKALVK